MAGQGLVIAQAVVLDGIGELGGVLVVDAVHLGGLDDGIALQFHAAQGGGGVGGEIGVAGTGGADDHTALFQMAHGAATDEGLAHFLHVDGGQNAGGVAEFFQHVLHGQGIEHRGQHAHIVGGGTFHALGGTGKAAEDVAAADDQGKFHAHVEQSADLLADGAHGFGVDTGFLLSGQGLAAQLEQHALVLEFSHMFRLG